MGFWAYIHIGLCLALFVYLGMLATSRGRSFFWGLIGPTYYTLISLMVWSLAGAETPILGLIGGVMGAICSYIVVYALDSAEALAAEAAFQAEQEKQGKTAPAT